MRFAASASFARSATTIAAFACLASLTYATEPQPDAAIKTRLIEAAVWLDEKIEADPALAGNCLAEGKQWMKKNAADAESSDPVMFRERSWKFERKYRIRSAIAERYISILRLDYEYTGGVHGNYYVNTVLWDGRAGKRISIRPFFTETADNGPTMRAIANAIVIALKAEKKKRGGPDEPNLGSFKGIPPIDWFKGIQPTLSKASRFGLRPDSLGPVVLAPSTEAGKSSGLMFNYEPYAVGSYADGYYSAFVPWQTFKQYLSPKGAAIFGGMRPSNDDDGLRPAMTGSNDRP